MAGQGLATTLSLSDPGSTGFVMGGSATGNTVGAINMTGAAPVVITSGGWTITGTSTYTGNTTLFGGTLGVASDASLGANTGAITFYGGTLQIAGSSSTFASNRSIAVNGPGALDTGNSGNAATFAGNMVNNGGITLQGAGAGAYSGLISGIGSLTKTGSGAWSLTNGVSNYSGGTIINGGTLRVANTTGASATGSGSVTLNGGTLASGATGSISGAVIAGSGAHTIAPGGVGSIGTLTVGSLTANNLSTFNFDLASLAGPNDLITDSSAFAFSGSGTAAIQVAYPGTVQNGTYKLIGFNSTSLATGISPANFSLSFNGGAPPGGYNLDLTSTELDLVIASTTPLPAITIAASNPRFLAGTTTAGIISGAVSNSGGVDFTFNSIVNKSSGVTGTLTSILPQSGTAHANNADSVPYTAAIDGTSATPGTSYIFATTVSDGTNSASSGSVALTAVATRTVNAPASATSLGLPSNGRLLVGTSLSVASNGTTYTYGAGGTGAHSDTEDATVVFSGGPDSNGISLTGGSVTANTSAGVSGTFTGSFSTAGSTSGSFNVNASGELSGPESPISIAYTADPVAKRTITNGATTDLGVYHTGASISATASNAFTTSGLHDTTTDVQVAAGTGSPDSNGIALSGGPTNFTGGASPASDTRTLSGAPSSPGILSGSFSLAVTTLENGGSGIGDTGGNGYSPVSVGYTVEVTDGQAAWTGGSTGSWTANTNWLDDHNVQAAPGVYGALSTADTATFGGTPASTITLDAASPTLAAITFNVPTSGLGYTISQGSGTNRVTLNGGGGPASVTMSGGTHNAITAPVTVVTGVNVTGAGILTLTGTGSAANTGNSFAGSLTVGDGTTATKLVINGGSTATATVAAGLTATVMANSTLELDGSQPALVDSGHLTDPNYRAAVENAGAFVVGNGTIAAVQQVGGIDGVGSTTVSDGSSLTADHINQAALVIGNDSTFTLAPSDMNGNAMAAAQLAVGSWQSAGGSSLVLAGSLTPSSSQIASSSLLGVGGTSSTVSPSLGGIGGTSISAVPEPSSIVILALGGLGLLAVARRRRCVC